MRYELDRERSRVEVHASSSVHPIRTGARVEGVLELSVTADGAVDLGAPVAASVSLELGGMRSGNPVVDREAERRLQIGRYPTVTGELGTLVLGPTPGTYRGTGRLTFHGVTRDVEGELVVAATEDGLAVTGSLDLDVTDFGVQPPSLLVVKVHRDIHVELDAHASPVDEPT